jgi:NitT/TauT family transport system substrate-binding protein
LPAILAQQLGYYGEAGVEVELINFKGGSQALTAVLGGSADVVSGFYDHTVEMAEKKKPMESIVVYDRFLGFALAVSPKAEGQVKSVSDLIGKKVGVTAPGSSTDFFIKYMVKKNGGDPSKVAIIGMGAGSTAVASMEQGQVDAGVMTDPALELLKGKFPNLRLLADTRTEKDNTAVFGSDYPSGSLYALTSWVQSHKVESQGLADGVVHTLQWIHAHSAQEIMDKMPQELTGGDKDLYLKSLTNAMAGYSRTGVMDPKGAETVLAVFSQSVPEIAAAHIDPKTTYTNEFVEKAGAKFGVKAN